MPVIKHNTAQLLYAISLPPTFDSFVVGSIEIGDESERKCGVDYSREIPRIDTYFCAHNAHNRCPDTITFYWAAPKFTKALMKTGVGPLLKTFCLSWPKSIPQGSFRQKRILFWVILNDAWNLSVLSYRRATLIPEKMKI